MNKDIIRQELIEIEKLRRCFAIGRLDVVFDRLIKLLQKVKNNDLENGEIWKLKENLYLLSSRYYILKEAVQDGIINQATANVEKNQIMKALWNTLEAVNELLGQGIEIKSNEDSRLLKVQITLNINFDEFDTIKRESIISLLKELLDLETIDVIRVKEGSTILEIALTREYVEKLMRFANSGFFKEFKLLDISYSHFDKIATIQQIDTSYQNFYFMKFHEISNGCFLYVFDINFQKVRYIKGVYQNLGYEILNSSDLRKMVKNHDLVSEIGDGLYLALFEEERQLDVILKITYTIKKEERWIWIERDTKVLNWNEDGSARKVLSFCRLLDYEVSENLMDVEFKILDNQLNVHPIDLKVRNNLSINKKPIFTSNEKAIAKMISKKITDQNITERLGISRYVLDIYKSQIKRKIEKDKDGVLELTEATI